MLFAAQRDRITSSMKIETNLIVNYNLMKMICQGGRNKMDAVEQARLARNAYQREWRAKNRDKVKEINLRYWARQGQQSEENEVQHAENADN